METQRRGVAFHVANPRSFNLSDTRTGKTRTALWAADVIMCHKPDTKALILANPTTLRSVWADSIVRDLRGSRTFHVLTGPSKERVRKIKEDRDFYILNHDGVASRGVVLALLERGDIDIFIGDEAEVWRHHTSRRSKLTCLLTERMRYVWLMTATPTPRAKTHPIDAYGIALIVHGKRQSFSRARDCVMRPVGPFGWEARPDAAKYVAEWLSPAFRVTQAECFDAPPETRDNYEIEMTPAQLKAYKELKTQAVTMLEDGKRLSVANEGVLRWKLIQICCGAVYDEDHVPHYLPCEPREQRLLEIIAQASAKVVVFAPILSVVDRIACILENNCYVVTGKLSVDEQHRRLTAFVNDPERKPLIAHPHCVARGLDLACAATIVWYGPTDQAGDYQQGNERINGPRQALKRSIIHFVSSPIEREIFSRLEAHETLQGVMLNIVKETSI